MTSGTDLAAIGFGLAASLSWGTSDFSGGFATKRAHVFGVMIVSYAVGLILLIPLALAAREPWLSHRDLAWTVAAGLAGTTGLTAFYQALSVGRMGIVAPVAAVLGAAVPVGASAVAEGLPAPPQMVGFALALLSIWLVSRPSQEEHRQNSGLGLAVVAGLGFGLFYTLIHQVSAGATYWPLTIARGVSLLIIGTLIRRGQVAWWPSRRALPIILVAGVLDTGGNVFFLLASHAGRLDVASVMSSFYPAVTVLLARTLLHEHISRLQATGVAAALLAIPLIAA